MSLTARRPSSFLDIDMKRELAPDIAAIDTIAKNLNHRRQGHTEPSPSQKSPGVASSQPPAITFVSHHGPNTNYHDPSSRTATRVLRGRNRALDLGAQRTRRARGPRAEPIRFVS